MFTVQCVRILSVNTVYDVILYTVVFPVGRNSAHLRLYCTEYNVASLFERIVNSIYYLLEASAPHCTVTCFMRYFAIYSLFIGHCRHFT